MVKSISINKEKEAKIFDSRSCLKFFLKSILALTFILSVIRSYAQEVKIYPTAGVTWRSSVMNVFNFKSIVPADPTIPYNYERNVQGFGVNVGLQMQLLNHFTIGYYPSLRYDYTHHYYDLSKNRLINVINGDSIYGNDHPIEVKDFIIDHNFNLILTKGVNFGAGLSIVNAGEGFEFVNPVPRYKHLEFKTYNVFLIIPFRKTVNLELKALYIPRGFPENPDEQYIMYSIRAYYRFDLNKTRNKLTQMAIR